MKTINKVMTHNEIYQIAVSLLNNFTAIDSYLPAAVAFSIQKNKQMMLNIANEIEESRLSILQHYNASNSLDNIEIPTNLIEQANNELKALLSIEQELKIYTFKIEELDGVKFTPNQMDSILFMIDEE